MKRILGLALTLALCAACRSQAPVYDPFLGRTTIAPPGTVAPPPGQPYYGAPAGTQFSPPIVTPSQSAGVPTPARPIGPASFAPVPAGGGLSSSFTPNVSPQGPTPARASGGINPLPVTPVSAPTRPTYGPPGGLAYPQAFNPPAATSSTQAALPVPLDVDRMTAGAATGSGTGTSSGGGVVPAARWESTGGGKTVGNATPASFTSPAQRSVIRIVEPAASDRPIVASTVPTGWSSAGSGPSAGGARAVSAGTLNQSLAVARVPEISELPPAAASRGSIPVGRTSESRPTPARPAAAISNGSESTGRKTESRENSAYSHDSGYRWLRGKLEYSQSTRRWRLRYMPADSATDDYGGSVILADAAKLNGLSAGDYVYAEGSVGATGADEGSFAPLYNATRIAKQ